MSSFTSPLSVTPLDDGRTWVLNRSFTYHICTKCSRNKITVPKGFCTDFASVPQIFWNILPPWGKYGKSAVIHDYIYQTHCRTRKEADAIFKEAMEVLGVPTWQVISMWLAVRLFGWLAWHKSS